MTEKIGDGLHVHPLGDKARGERVAEVVERGSLSGNPDEVHRLGERREVFRDAVGRVERISVSEDIAVLSRACPERAPEGAQSIGEPLLEDGLPFARLGLRALEIGPAILHPDGATDSDSVGDEVNVAPPEASDLLPSELGEQPEARRNALLGRGGRVQDG